MPLLAPDTSVSDAALEAVRAGLLADLRETAESLVLPPGAGAERAARARTVRELVRDALAAASAVAPVERPRAARVAEVNLLYDVVLVAAEYYKLFVREPTAARPAGRI